MVSSVKRMKVRDLRAGAICRTRDGWWGVLGTWTGGNSRAGYRRFDPWDTKPFRLSIDEVVDVPEGGSNRTSDGGSIISRVALDPCLFSEMAQVWSRLRHAHDNRVLRAVQPMKIGFAMPVWRVMSHLVYATESALRSVRCRVEGKHDLQNQDIAWIHATEWGLTSLEVTQLRRAIQVEDERLRAREKR